VILYTVGHSTRSAGELVDVLDGVPIRRLVDVRTVPRSRRNPQFNRDELAAFLPRHGIEYRHVAALGGLRHPRPDSPNGAWTVPGFRGYADWALGPEFAAALDELLAWAAETPTTVMCAEAVWWRCHRRIIADWAIARGAEVVHILARGKTDAGTLTPFARIQSGRVLYPGLT
jgi:uncharacterized protein (DUF488 family)